jgi:hypothetical protein
MPIIFVGLACIIYLTAEIAAAAARRPTGAGGSARFGAVDLETGRELDVTLDRRGRPRDRRTLTHA